MVVGAGEWPILHTIIKTPMSTLFESGYEQFECLGADCEATCCNGWQVAIDKATYRRYKSNQHPSLKALFRQAVKRNKKAVGDTAYGVFVMEKNGDCPFFQEGLCRIHSLLGADALSEICASYPRIVTAATRQQERSLDVSCPEAARLVLLQREGLRFIEREDQSAGAERRPPHESEGIQVANEIRALIIFILQYREVTIETRLVMVGLLLELMEAEVLPLSGESASKLPVLVARVQQLLSGANTLEAELATVETSEALQLKIFGGMVECLRKSGPAQFVTCIKEAGDGLYRVDEDRECDGNLLQRMTIAFERYYEPFVVENLHIIENYLVHSVFQSAFPFHHDKPLNQYRRLVINFVVIRLVLLGMAAYHKGLTEDIAIRFAYSFSRFSQHNARYEPHLVQLLDEYHFENYRDLFVLIAGNGSPRKGDASASEHRLPGGVPLATGGLPGDASA